MRRPWHGGIVGMPRKEFSEYLSSFSMLTFGIIDGHGADDRTPELGDTPVDLLRLIERLTFYLEIQKIISDHSMHHRPADTIHSHNEMSGG